MLTFQDIYTICQDESSDTDTTSTLPFFKRKINEGLDLIYSELGSFYTEEEFTATTVASQQEYELPARYLRLKSVTITVSSIPYVVYEIEDHELWDELNASQTSTSDIPQFYFLKKDKIEFFPIPASSSNTITFICEVVQHHLSQADYTTGTVSALANGAAAVTGNGTTWTAAMVGRYFKINSDNVWYKIASRSGNTAITLDKNYEGTTISAGSENYTIGEIPNLPPEVHTLPAYYALAHYYAKHENKEMQAIYWGLFTVGPAGRDSKGQALAGLEGAKRRWSRKSGTGIVRGKSILRRGIRYRDPNRYPTGLS